MKKLLKPIYRPPHQSKSKDFNQIGEIGEKLGQIFGFDFGLQSQFEFWFLKQ